MHRQWQRMRPASAHLLLLVISTSISVIERDTFWAWIRKDAASAFLHHIEIRLPSIAVKFVYCSLWGNYLYPKLWWCDRDSERHQAYGLVADSKDEFTSAMLP
ncbi:hypothetical protein DL95DRAFT_415426 [Leptodontidium sp. 2 PMI_412]|nr:hypothetical protein DL95DRAFT_415426 [Leptodontidium sp. 2 PMI_412]